MRKEDAYFDEIPNVKVPADMLQLAEHILEQKKGHFDPDKFEDRYEDALSELIKAKRAGKAAAEPRRRPKPTNVINLMDALRRSVKATRAQAARAQNRRRARPRKRRSRAKKKPRKPSA